MNKNKLIISLSYLAIGILIICSVVGSIVLIRNIEMVNKAEGNLVYIIPGIMGGFIGFITALFFKLFDRLFDVIKSSKIQLEEIGLLTNNLTKGKETLNKYGEEFDRLIEILRKIKSTKKNQFYNPINIPFVDNNLYDRLDVIRLNKLIKSVGKNADLLEGFETLNYLKENNPEIIYYNYKRRIDQHREGSCKTYWCGYHQTHISEVISKCHRLKLRITNAIRQFEQTEVKKKG